MTTIQRNGIAFFGLAVLARLLFQFATGFVADDAFITFRYAQNLADGLGFVYNEGEQVLGTSTPMFTFVLAFAHLMRLSLPVAALFVSLVCCFEIIQVDNTAGKSIFATDHHRPTFLFVRQQHVPA